jgi:hypothetical protein
MGTYSTHATHATHVTYVTYVTYVTHVTHATHESSVKPLSQNRFRRPSANLLSPICYLLFVITT